MSRYRSVRVWRTVKHLEAVKAQERVQSEKATFGVIHRPLHVTVPPQVRVAEIEILGE